MHGSPLPYNRNQKHFTTNPPKRENANELDEEMSEIEPLKPGGMIEPVVFEPKRKIRLSRSTYKVNSYIDFRPYQNAFKKFESYLNRFSRDLRDPDYVGALVNAHRFKLENYEYIRDRDKPYFGPTTCNLATYACRVKKQYMRIVFETNKLRQLFNKIFEKFLKAIDHMEFHPTLGKKKKGTSYKLHKRSAKDREASMIHQMKYLSPDDMKMLRQGNELIQKKYLKTNSTRHRTKRFSIATWLLGWGIYRNMRSLHTLKNNIQTLYNQNILQEKQIIELTHFLNVTYGHVSANRMVINELNIQIATLNKTMMAVIGETKFIKFTVAALTDMRMTLAQLSLGLMSLQENVNAIYEYMRVLSTRRVNPLIIPPESLRMVLAQAKEDMKRNPRLTLPEDPNVNIWNYYSIMKVTPVIMDNFLLVILTIPLADQSLVMNLYKVHNMPALHPELHVQFEYRLEGEYLAITKDKQYAALPTARDIRICETTERYLCPMNQALYPVDKIEWCIYALYKQDTERIGTYCTIVTTYRHANMAQSLDGYLWAVSSLKEEKMRIRCLEDSHLEDIKPPLTIIYIGDGCEGYSSNLFIPAKSELTSEDKTLTRHVFFLDFNDEYQDLTKYSLIEQLNLPQLTAKELEELPNRLTALQPMTLNHLKERIKPLSKYQFNVHPNVVLIILMASLLPMLAGIGFIVWRVYKVRSRIKGFKPMAKLLLGDDLQNPKLNEETARQVLALIRNPITTVTHNLTQPSTSSTQQETVKKVPASLVTTKPANQGIPPPPPPPRGMTPPIKRVLPAKSTEQMTEVLKEVMLELEPASPAMKKYRKYLQRQNTDDDEITKL